MEKASKGLSRYQVIKRRARPMHAKVVVTPHGGKSIVFARIELYVGNGVKAFILTSSLAA